MNVDPARLRDAFLGDLAAAWTYSRHRHERETPYALVLWGVEGGPRFTPHVLTEEGLTQIAKQYVQRGYHDDLDEAKRSLRYSVADAPRFDEMIGQLPNVDALFPPEIAQSMSETAAYTLLADAAIAALVELDRQGLFDTGADRERLLLVIITEDTKVDLMLSSARRLNPPEVIRKFESEVTIQGSPLSSEGIAVGQSSIYSRGKRENPDGRAGGKNQRLEELVAYDHASDGTLRRRWAHTLSASKASTRAIACTPDGSTALVLRMKHASIACRLMRFTRDKADPLQEHQYGGYGVLAVSPDGTRVAIKSTQPTLDILDVADFKLVRSRKLQAKPFAMQWLASGAIVLATETALICVAPESDAPPTSVSMQCNQLSSDRAGQYLAVSRYFTLSGPERDNPPEFGIELLNQTTLQPVRTFLLPGHQASCGTLSPDGRLLAFEANELGKPRAFIAIFDIASGRELGRRKSDALRVYLRGLSFLPDNRTLAIPTSTLTPAEPIELWSP